MNALYRGELRAFMNYFQPSVKLVERVLRKSRAATLRQAKTPFERLIELGSLSPERIVVMREERARLDPFVLGAAIASKVTAILAIPHSTPRARTASNRPAGTGLYPSVLPRW